MTPDRLVSVSTVARCLNVHAETVRGWIRRGRLDAIRTPAGVYRIRQSILDALLTQIKSQKSQKSQSLSP